MVKCIHTFYHMWYTGRVSRSLSATGAGPARSVLWKSGAGKRYKSMEQEAVMIDVTRLNGTEIMINAELIEMVEETPDTVISLTTGKKLIVKESRQEIKSLVKSYKRDILARDLVGELS